MPRKNPFPEYGKDMKLIKYAGRPLWHRRGSAFLAGKKYKTWKKFRFFRAWK